MASESIKVCCRFRKENIEASDEEDWQFDVDKSEIKLHEKKWTYDYILNHLTEQAEMYDKVAKQTITDFMYGFNATIFAYGQSGSGKTFSMLGPEDVVVALSKDFKSVPESVTFLYGITPRAVIQMFETINLFVTQGANCTLMCSYIEIYNETIKCLLSKKDNLKIREQPGMGMNVADKEVRICKTPEEIFEVVSIASNNRAVTSTHQNARSSRSHTILLLEFEYNGLDGVRRCSRLNLVDLAGSERISKTGVEGAALKEAQKINQSLSTLGMCIMALTTPGSKHIPFRNSKLTLILKESLGGNSKTTLLCTASRRKFHSEESAQTLYFASRAKAIKNSCKTNIQLSGKELQYLVDHMKKEILTLRGQLKKAGVNFNLISDPKMLAMISNAEFDNEGDGDETQTGSTTNSNSKEPIKSRLSLANLSEKDVIIKYCELRAKYDNLFESAGNAIYKLNVNNSSETVESEILIKEKNEEILSLHEKIENLKKDNFNNSNSANKQVKDLQMSQVIIQEELESNKKEYDSLQEMFNMTQNDITFFQEKLAGKKKKHHQLKEDHKVLKNDFSQKLQLLEETSKRVLEADSKHLENKQKIEEVANKNEMLLLEIENLKNLLKQRLESEAIQREKNRELQEEISRHLDNFLTKDKKISELGNKIQENEAKNKNEIESLINKQNFHISQIDSLRKENENLQKMMQEKISVGSLLAEKEKILNDVKSTLEKRIDDLQKENDKVKFESLNTLSNFNTEKTEFSSQIEMLSLEIKTKSGEIEQRKFEYENLKKSEEEKLKLEKTKLDQSTLRLENFEKKHFELENLILNLTENDKKISSDKISLEKETREKTSQLEDQSSKYSTLHEKYEKEAKELSSAMTKLNSDFESERKDLRTENLSHGKKVEDGERKLSELKAELKVLQNLNQSLVKKCGDLELSNSRNRRVSNILQKDIHSIKEKTPLNKNIFGVLLKKTDNHLIKNAIEETRMIEKQAENIFQDKIEEFRKFRENIISLSPKTVSSRCI